MIPTMTSFLHLSLSGSCTTVSLSPSLPLPPPPPAPFPLSCMHTRPLAYKALALPPSLVWQPPSLNYCSCCCWCRLGLQTSRLIDSARFCNHYDCCDNSASQSSTVLLLLVSDRMICRHRMYKLPGAYTVRNAIQSRLDTERGCLALGFSTSLSSVHGDDCAGI